MNTSLSTAYYCINVVHRVVFVYLSKQIKNPLQSPFSKLLEWNNVAQQLFSYFEQFANL